MPIFCLSTFMPPTISNPIRVVSILGVMILLAILCVDLPAVNAQERDQDLEERVDQLESENQELRAILKQMQERIEQLESTTPKGEPVQKSATPAVEVVAQPAEELPKEAEAPEQAEEETPEEEEEPDEWLPSFEGEEFRLGGRMQLDYYDTQHERALPSAEAEAPGGQFVIDEFRLRLEGDFANQIRVYSEFDAVNEEGESELVEAYADFEELPFTTRLRAGLQTPFFRPSRYTEYYPLTGTAFWRERDIGLTWERDFENLTVYASVMNGTALDDRNFIEDDSTNIISQNNPDFDVDHGPDLMLGLGHELDFDDYGSVELMGFGLTGDLADEDVRFLQTEVPGYGQSMADRRERAGGSLEYSIGEWDFFSQAIAGEDGDLGRFSWYAELSHKFDIDDVEYLNWIRPLIRYSELDTNLSARPFSDAGSLTWDHQQWLFAVIMELVDNVDFHIEYALNEEDTGGPNASNNELLFQLELEF